MYVLNIRYDGVKFFLEELNTPFCLRALAQCSVWTDTLP
jgi:hypothetical protein